jgi:hypothetical protein
MVFGETQALFEHHAAALNHFDRGRKSNALVLAFVAQFDLGTNPRDEVFTLRPVRLDDAGGGGVLLTSHRGFLSIRP